MTTTSMPATPVVATEVAVAVSDLVKTYADPEGGEFNAVDGLTFDVHRGEIFGFLGPNGAGKSTTLEMMEGLRTPTSGTARVLGMDAHAHPASVKERIGVQLQASSYFEYLTLEELLTLFGSFYPESQPAVELLEKVGLTEKRRSLVGQLSGGQAQRFSIVAALVNDPDVVFLDEPTTGLDPQARRNLWELIEEINQVDGKTVILTTHYMDEAERLSDRVAIIDHGRIQALDTPTELIRTLASHHEVAFSTRHRIVDVTLADLPEVAEVDVKGNGRPRHFLATTDPAATVPAVFDLARRNGFTVEDLTVRAPSLEDVFLNVTGRSLRD